MLETQVKGKPPGLNEAVVWDHQVGGRCCEGLARSMEEMHALRDTASKPTHLGGMV